MLEEDRIFKINIENEMKSAYIDYSMSVIVSRALPDVRDGMKPVHRQIGNFVLHTFGSISNGFDCRLFALRTHPGEREGGSAIMAHELVYVSVVA